MKIILQDLKKGETFTEEVPIPNCGINEILIKVKKSVISLGTEKTIVQFGKSSYLQKAKQQPDKVKMVKNKVKTDGLIPTINTVITKLNDPMPLGYSNSGVVIEVGSNVNEFKLGDRVISNGHHSEVVAVNKNLAAKIPPKLKQKNNTAKYILKKIASEILPKEIIYRSKSGFGAPIRLSMSSKPFQEMKHELLNKGSIEKRGLFEYKKIKSYLKNSNNSDNSYGIFSMMCIELWCKNLLDADTMLK